MHFTGQDQKVLYMAAIQHEEEYDLTIVNNRHMKKYTI